MPKVSIIVPIHNPGKYLIPMVNSLIYQTFKDIEILLIDDGSTDGSRDILQDFATKDERITVIFREKSPDEHFGQKYSLDLGRSIAKGEYIIMVDHDDELTLDAVELLYNATNNGTIDVVQGRYRQVNEQNNVVYRTPNFFPQPTLFNQLDGISEEVLLYHLVYAPVALWACLIRKDFQKNLKLSDCIFNDTNFIWELKINAKSFGYIPNEIYQYRANSNSISSKDTNSVCFHMFTIFEELEQMLKQWNISDQLWKMFYAYKFCSLYKMIGGITEQTKLIYFKKISEAIQNDLDISLLLTICCLDVTRLIIYYVLRNYKE